MAKPVGRKEVKVNVNVDNEQITLSSMMKDKNILRDLAGGLERDSFLADRHKSIFSILQDISFRKLEFDIEVFIQLAGKRDYGGRSYIENLQEAFKLPKNIDYHTGKLRTDAAKYKLRSGPLARLVDLCEDPNADIDEISAGIQNVNAGVLLDLSIGVSLGKPLYRKYLSDIRARRKNPQFVPTGFPYLDGGLTEGLARKKISVWTGRPSMGKSTWAWNMADRIANRWDIKTIVFCLEMTEEAYMDGIVSSRTGISIEKLVKKVNELTNKDLKKINDTVFEITKNQRLVFWDKSLDNAKLARILAEGGYQVAIFDLYEKMIKDKVQEKIAADLDYKQQMAKDMNCHMAFFHQTRRGVEKRANKRPTLEDLKNSGGYEEVPDLVVSFYREKYYNPDFIEDVMESWVLKQRRGGRLFSVFHEFDGRYARIGKARKDYSPPFGGDSLD